MRSTSCPKNFLFFRFLGLLLSQCTMRALIPATLSIVQEIRRGRFFVFQVTLVNSYNYVNSGIVTNLSTVSTPTFVVLYSSIKRNNLFFRSFFINGIIIMSTWYPNHFYFRFWYVWHHCGCFLTQTNWANELLSVFGVFELRRDLRLISL